MPAGKKTDPTTINYIQEARKRGFTYIEISKKFGVPKTTVYAHAKDVVVLHRFLEVLHSKGGGTARTMKQKQHRCIQKARGSFPLNYKLSFNEKVIILGMLYWAEGSKRAFSFVNTDPKMISLFVTLVRDVFELDDARFRLTLRLYGDLDLVECITFWEKIVKVPVFSVHRLSGKPNGKLKYGMCKVDIRRGSDILHMLNAYNKVLTDNFAPIA